jgi:hypothetical protein
LFLQTKHQSKEKNSIFGRLSKLVGAHLPILVDFE